MSSSALLVLLSLLRGHRVSGVVYEPFTYRKKAFAFTYKALYLLLFNYSSDAGPAERAILFLSRCSLSSSDCACAVTAGVSSPLTSRGVRGRMGWGGVCVLRLPEGLDDNCVDGGNDSPLPCGVLSSSQHRPDSHHLFSKPRCRASFEHSLLDVGPLQQFFPVFKHPSFILQC